MNDILNDISFEIFVVFFYNINIYMTPYNYFFSVLVSHFMKMDKEVEEQNLVRAAIGRVASIGDLYDARSEQFIGFSLFNKQLPKDVIKETDNPFTDSQFIHSDTYSEKFDKLNIKAEFKVSILAGLLGLGGSGKYLMDEKKSARAIRSSLLYNIQTKVERISLFDVALKDCFSIEALNQKATHVVVEVGWGANSLITMEFSNKENKDIKTIQGSLEVSFRILKIDSY